MSTHSLLPRHQVLRPTTDQTAGLRLIARRVKAVAPGLLPAVDTAVSVWRRAIANYFSCLS